MRKQAECKPFSDCLRSDEVSRLSSENTRLRAAIDGATADFATQQEAINRLSSENATLRDALSHALSMIRANATALGDAVGPSNVGDVIEKARAASELPYAADLLALESSK